MVAIYWRLVLLLLMQIVEVRSHTLYKWLVDSKTQFNYDTDPNNRLGVYNWKHTYPDSCAGQYQSPVNIQTEKVRYRRGLPCPQMSYTNPVMRGVLKNNGQSATFEPEGEIYRLTNVPYRPGTYNLNDFHFHFGGIKGRIFEMQGRRFRGDDVISAGSEHTIDGLRFEGEVHFVFYKSDYENLELADNKTDGVVVMSMLVQKVPDHTRENVGTGSFSEFVERNIPRVAKYKQNVTTEVDLSMFLNRDCHFYTYFGSTTTPNCRQVVQWLILREPLKVKDRAWNQLTRLESRGDFNFRFGNYRNTQPLNGRIIEANFPRETGPVLPSPNDQFVRPRSEIFGTSDSGATRRQSQTFRNNAIRSQNRMPESSVMRARGQTFINDQIRSPSRMINDRRSGLRSRMSLRNTIQAPRNIGMPRPALFMQPNGPVRRVSMVDRPMIREAERFISRDFQPSPRRIHSRRGNLIVEREPTSILSPIHSTEMKRLKLPIRHVWPKDLPRRSMAKEFRGPDFPLPIIIKKPITVVQRPPPLEIFSRKKYSPKYQLYADGLWRRLCDLNRKLF